nr:hypothetical protein Iba_chr01dCG15970 [Ipomoea batatas]GME18320.1 hypothetical protein Iba_scaffold20400CG0020 [Ipomoea batatas]
MEPTMLSCTSAEGIKYCFHNEHHEATCVRKPSTVQEPSRHILSLRAFQRDHRTAAIWTA